jgi:hypothetical protein
MDDVTATPPVMECGLAFGLTDGSGVPGATGGATARLDVDQLSVVPSAAEPLFVSYRTIISLDATDYLITMRLSSGEQLQLSKLGYAYEDFARELVRLRNEQVLADMLMEEPLLDGGATGEFTFVSAGETRTGPGEVRVYETALVVLPDSADLRRLALADIAQVTDGDYSLIVSLETGAQLTLSRLGPRLDPLRKSLSDAMNALSLKAQALLAESAPGVDPMVLRKAARFLRDGRAGRRKDIEAVSPDAWTGLEQRVKTAGGWDAYTFLSSLARQDRMAIGIKRGLMGDLTGEYVWFLAPIYDADASKPGNVIAMEAYDTAEGAEGGHATYFFRIAPRPDYAGFTTVEQLHAATDSVLTRLNRAMLEVNFRREPIYLPEERLLEPKYLRYYHSVRRLPALRLLRERFVGRVVHLDPGQWQRDVNELLAFNVSTTDDAARFRGAEPAVAGEVE